jgi:hypothetical protein
MAIARRPLGLVAVRERTAPLGAFVLAALFAATPARGRAQESAAGLTAPRPNTRELAVVRTAVVGIDPIVGEHVTTRIMLTAQAMGYVLSGSDEVAAAEARLRAGSPPSPADLWRVAFLAGAERAIVARAWAQNGRYVIELLVASLDGTGPFRVTGTSGADDLHQVVEALVRQVLPPPTTWDAATAARLRAQALGQAPAPSAMAPARPPIAAPAPRSRHPGRRFDLAIQTEAAFGAGARKFYNHLIGARLDVRITRTFLIGAYFGYANLRGRNSRVSNLVTYLQLEDRIEVVGVEGLSIPLRAGAGYVPFNGPILRIAAGVNYAINERFEIGADLLSPTFWFVGGDRPVSFDLALEGIYRF